MKDKEIVGKCENKTKNNCNKKITRTQLHKSDPRKYKEQWDQKISWLTCDEKEADRENKKAKYMYENI